MASSGLPPRSPCSSSIGGPRDGCSTPEHHSSHLEVTAPALGGKVTAALSAWALSCLVLHSQNSGSAPGTALPPSSTTPAEFMTRSLRGTGTLSLHCLYGYSITTPENLESRTHILLLSVQSQDMNPSPTHPITGNWLFSGFGQIFPAKQALKQNTHVLQGFSQLPDRPIIGKEKETGLQIAPRLMLKQGSTCAALCDSQLSHLP